MNYEENKKSVQRAQMIQEEIECAMERCLKEADVTYAEALGALCLVRASMERKYFKNIEPD